MSRSQSLKPYLPLIAATLVLILVIAIVERALSRRVENDGPEQQTPTPTVLNEAGVPIAYKNTQIPAALYQEGMRIFTGKDTNTAHDYVVDRIKRYYIYQDVLRSRGSAYTLRETFSFPGIEKEIITMEEELQKNAIATVDFAYIKAKFKNIRGESEVRSQYGSPSDLARSLIEIYRTRLAAPGADIQTIVAQANQDPALSLLNDQEQNEFRSGYTVSERLFYSDAGFHTFLFAQSTGKVSERYELKDTTGAPYAYIVVFVSRKSDGSYPTASELMRAYEIYFQYNES